MAREDPSRGAPGAAARPAPADEIAGSAEAACPECLALDGTCPRCVQRGAYALRLLEQGHSVSVAARRLRLTPERVLDLAGLASDRQAVRRYRRQRPRLTDARAFIDAALADDPELTRADIARRMDPPMHPIDFDRTFGYAKAAGHAPRHVSVRMGSRLMLALGRAPHELDGC